LVLPHHALKKICAGNIVVSENFTRRMMPCVSVWRMLIGQKSKPDLVNMKSYDEVLFLICAEGDLFTQWWTAFFIDDGNGIGEGKQPDSKWIVFLDTLVFDRQIQDGYNPPIICLKWPSTE
jgi:hypothetical protein